MSHHRNRLLLATAIVCLTGGTHQALAQDIGGGFATRLLSDGSIDASFQDGVFGFGLAMAAAVDGENRVIIAGTRDGKFVVTRLLASGAVDLDFGINGVAEKGFTGGAEARAVAIAPSGRIIVAGTAAQQFAIACFTAYGGDCPWFGGNSKVTTAFDNSAEALAIAIAGDGRIVVGGRVSYWSNAQSATQDMFALARYEPSGMLDASFGAGGKRTYNAGAATWPATNHESISGLAIDASGRIVAAGTFSAQNVSPRFALLRFRADGGNDTTFGPNSTGMATAFGSCHGWVCYGEAFGTSVALQSDGKIVVAGGVRLSSNGSSDYDVALARFRPDGLLDSGFGNNGYVQTQLGSYEEAAAVKVAGGSLYVAGHSGGLAIVARYSVSNGLPVSDFDDGVVMPTTPCTGPAFALVVQSFPCRGTFCAPIRKPVIVGTCISGL
jgi:uncharacterized delta-60 repeat protein